MCVAVFFSLVLLLFIRCGIEHRICSSATETMRKSAWERNIAIIRKQQQQTQRTKQKKKIIEHIMYLTAFMAILYKLTYNVFHTCMHTVLRSHVRCHKRIERSRLFLILWVCIVYFIAALHGMANILKATHERDGDKSERVIEHMQADLILSVYIRFGIVQKWK